MGIKNNIILIPGEKLWRPQRQHSQTAGRWSFANQQRSPSKEKALPLLHLTSRSKACIIYNVLHTTASAMEVVQVCKPEGFQRRKHTVSHVISLNDEPRPAGLRRRKHFGSDHLTGPERVPEGSQTTPGDRSSPCKRGLGGFTLCTFCWAFLYNIKQDLSEGVEYSRPWYSRRKGPWIS